MLSVTFHMGLKVEKLAIIAEKVNITHVCIFCSSIGIEFTSCPDSSSKSYKVLGIYALNGNLMDFFPT